MAVIGDCEGIAEKGLVKALFESSAFILVLWICISELGSLNPVKLKSDEFLLIFMGIGGSFILN